jgi:hypothetical protein
MEAASIEGPPPPPAIIRADEGDADPSAPAAPLEEHGPGDWAFRLVRGSIYVTGGWVEALAREGKAAMAAAPGLTPGK